MTQNITKYYIPQNLNISKGKIYNMYLNKVTNLDLSQIITTKDVWMNWKVQYFDWCWYLLANLSIDKILSNHYNVYSIWF